MAECIKRKHFLLVHGTNHGAWCWYKVKPRLEAVGHRVTVLDLAASGINMKKIQDLHTFNEYNEPLLEILASLPADEKVILVGHSLGGLSLALAMDKFPEKISVAVFLTAFMPDTTHRPSYVLEQILERSIDFLDTRFSSSDTSNASLTSITFGPKFLASNLYQLSPIEDLELAKTLVRPGSLFVDDLSKASNFSEEGYGSAKRVYVVCDEDKTIPKEFQLWMIQNNPVEQVMEIKGADHMPMLSKPQELCDRLIELAH